MPIYVFKCVNCGGEAEQIMSWEKLQRSEVLCIPCGLVMKQQMTCHAHTPSRFGDQTGTYGVNGKYNKGLGCYVNNDRHAEQIAKSRGLVPFSEAFSGRSFESVTDSHMDSSCIEALKLEADSVAVRDRVAAGADLGEAFAEVYSVDRMKQDGLLSDDVRG
jgi:predicted nucleic acid-binding Zn ribbon protein